MEMCTPGAGYTLNFGHWFPMGLLMWGYPMLNVAYNYYVTAKTSLDVFSLRQEQVWTFSVLGDRIYEMRCLFVAVGLNALFAV